MVVWNAFISGLLYLFYMFTEGWFWILGLVLFIVMAFIENKDISEQYIDDERKLL